MSEEKTEESTETTPPEGAEGNPEPQEASSGDTADGPKFTKGPDPLSGVKKASTDAWDSMEGKTVSMRTYVLSIIGVILLMLLARCGG